MENSTLCKRTVTIILIITRAKIIWRCELGGDPNLPHPSGTGTPVCVTLDHTGVPAKCHLIPSKGFSRVHDIQTTQSVAKGVTIALGDDA